MSKNKKTGEYYDKVPNLQNQGKSKYMKQLSRSVGAFLVIALSIVIYFLFLRASDLMRVASVIISILEPIIYGLVIAYLLNPLMKKIEKYIYLALKDKCEITKDVKKCVRMTGIAISILVFLLIIFLLFYMIIPEVWRSIESLIVTLPSQINSFVTSLSNMKIPEGEWFEVIEVTFSEAYEFVMQWVQTELVSQVNGIMSNVTFGVLAVFNVLYNLVMGIIISIYVLLKKEVFLGQCKKSIYALLSIKNANLTLHIMNKSNMIFGGFIIGKLIDSMIIGAITFICLSIMKMPYTLLVTVVVGVTNIIPFFGPFIGGIPCAILILLQSPIQGLYFAIYIIVLQQVDGNIIGPKILGDSTGLSSFWVIFSIMLAGGLFGFPGMVIGVPTFAVIYYIVGLFINHRLREKHLPTNSEGYDECSYVDDVTGEFVSSVEHRERVKDVELHSEEREENLDKDEEITEK